VSLASDAAGLCQYERRQNGHLLGASVDLVQLTSRQSWTWRFISSPDAIQTINVGARLYPLLIAVRRVTTLTQSKPFTRTESK